jgi:hypothetical protein
MDFFNRHKRWLVGAATAISLFSCVCCGCGGFFVGLPAWDKARQGGKRQEVNPLVEGVVMPRSDFKKIVIGLDKAQVKEFLGGPPMSTMNTSIWDSWTYAGRTVNSDTGKQDREMTLIFDGPADQRTRVTRINFQE